jgi:uncharacterized protein YebE (UPF0316 family)
MIAWFNSLLASDIFRILLLPILIFIAKVVDISISTIGLIFTARGFKKLATFTSFLEISIYLLAIATILDHINEWQYFLAYVAGYAAGTYVGMWIEEKLSIGFFHIRFVTRKNPERFLKSLRGMGFRPTTYRAYSSSRPVHVIQTVVRRRQMTDVTDRIASFDRNAFYAVEDIRQVHGFHPAVDAAQR